MMLSREEYEEGIIRMYDSIRPLMYSGREDCEGVKCGNCPFYSSGACNEVVKAFDMIEIVEKWIKDNE